MEIEITTIYLQGNLSKLCFWNHLGNISCILVGLLPNVSLSWTKQMSVNVTLVCLTLISEVLHHPCEEFKGHQSLVPTPAHIIARNCKSHGTTEQEDHGKTHHVICKIKDENNWSTSQISQCNSPIPYNAPLCNRNVHMCAHFCYIMMHRGTFFWSSVGFVRWVSEVRLPWCRRQYLQENCSEC